MIQLQNVYKLYKIYYVHVSIMNQ